MYLEKTDDHDVFNNVIYQCAQVKYAGALEVQSNPFGYDVTHNRPDDKAPRKVGGNRLFNNTAIGGWWSLAVHCDSPDCSVSKTEVRDNICVGADGKSASLYLHGGGSQRRHARQRQHLRQQLLRPRRRIVGVGLDGLSRLWCFRGDQRRRGVQERARQPEVCGPIARRLSPWQRVTLHQGGRAPAATWVAWMQKPSPPSRHRRIVGLAGADKALKPTTKPTARAVAQS